MSMTIANAVLVHYWSHKPHWSKHYIKVIIDCNGCNPFSQCFCNKGEREREDETTLVVTRRSSIALQEYIGI